MVIGSRRSLVAPPPPPEETIPLIRLTFFSTREQMILAGPEAQVAQVQDTFQRVHESLPQIRIVWSEILPRRAYRGFSREEQPKMERVRLSMYKSMDSCGVPPRPRCVSRTPPVFDMRMNIFTEMMGPICQKQESKYSWEA